jgi:hypothetical protein
MSDVSTLLLAGSIVGIVGGLLLLARGFAGYRQAGRVADTATSPIGTLAVGEVRVTGRVEPGALTLTSPIQGQTCVYYRAHIREPGSQTRITVLEDERAVGFRVGDETGAIRVFPRGATWDVPTRFKDSDGWSGDAPAGLSLRPGSAIQPASENQDELVARLLTVRPPLERFVAGVGAGRRDYEESRVELGDTVTVVGTALPFDQLPDPGGADASDGAASGGPLAAADDPEIAADLAAARAAGTLETDPHEAWGNAAIPGFGIGMPVRAPELKPGAIPPGLADAQTAERFQRAFEIAHGELVLALGPDRPLLISLGAPASVVIRGQDRFLVGLLGAVLAIASAIALALVLAEGIRP